MNKNFKVLSNNKNKIFMTNKKKITLLKIMKKKRKCLIKSEKFLINAINKNRKNYKIPH